MKKLLYLLLMISLFAACKKDKNDPPTDPGDDPPAFSLKGTVWAGQYKHENQLQPEPYALDFFSDTKFTFRNFDGDTEGSYTISGVKVTLNFPALKIAGTTGTDVKIIVQVSEVKTFAKIEQLTATKWIVQNGNKITDWEQPIGNTTWYGQTDGPYSGGYSLTFKSNNKVFIAGVDNDYTKKGGTLRFSYPDHSTTVSTFCVFFGGTAMKGVVAYSTNRNPFTLAKQ